MIDAIVGVLTIVGSIIASLIGAFYGARSYFKEEARRRHLADIKSECLKPLFSTIRNNLISEIEWGENKRPTSDYIERDPWTKHLEVYYYYDVNRILFEDLKNHFPDLYRMLKRIEDEVARKEMVRYKRVEHKLTSYIWRHVEKYVSDENKRTELVLACVNELLGYDRDSCPNVYEHIREWGLLPALDETLKYVNEMHKADVEEAVRTREQINQLLRECINMIDKALLCQKLSGKCEYL